MFEVYVGLNRCYSSMIVYRLRPLRIPPEAQPPFCAVGSVVLNSAYCFASSILVIYELRDLLDFKVRYRSSRRLRGIEGCSCGLVRDVGGRNWIISMRSCVTTSNDHEKMEV